VTMKVLLFVLLLLPACARYSYAWTASEWLGVIEATAGTAVLKAHDVPSSDICENCSGTGKLGDGTVSVKCPVCDGTGKPATMKADPIHPRMDAPAVKQDAATSGGGTYKRGLFRRR